MSPKSLKHVEACDSEEVRTLHVLLDINVRERTTVYYIFVKEEEQTLSTTLETYELSWTSRQKKQEDVKNINMIWYIIDSDRTKMKKTLP